VSHINDSRVGIAGSDIIGFLLRTQKKINISGSHYLRIFLTKIDNNRVKTFFSIQLNGINSQKDLFRQLFQELLLQGGHILPAYHV